MCVCVPALTCPGTSYIWTVERYVGAPRCAGKLMQYHQTVVDVFFAAINLEKRVVKPALICVSCRLVPRRA